MTGLIVVIVVLVLSVAFWLWRSRHDGTVRAVPRIREREASGEESGASAAALTASDLGGDLGARATLVQFSTAFCQPCRAARGTLSHVARTDPGVVHLEIDAENNLGLVRRLGVTRTPTTLILDERGRIVGRATGVPRLDEVRAALP